MYQTIKTFRQYTLYSLDDQYGICKIDYEKTQIVPIVDHNGMFFNDEVESIFNQLD